MALDHHYSSGRVYVWDHGRGRGIRTGEIEDGEGSLPRLPTIDRDILKGWKQEFVADRLSADARASLASTMEAWLDGSTADRTLPTPIRHQWNGELKRRVLERLEEWFRDTGISAPSDAIRTETFRASQTDVERLRDLVIRCVRGMTREELEELRLPPAAFLRIRA